MMHSLHEKGDTVALRAWVLAVLSGASLTGWVIGSTVESRSAAGMEGREHASSSEQWGYTGEPGMTLGENPRSHRGAGARP